MSTRLTPYDSSIQTKLREMWSCICKIQQGGDSPVVTGNTATITFSGNGTSGSPLTATYIGPAGATVADVTGLIGMTAVVGTATTAARSDGRHAIDPAIAPDWTGYHKFNMNGRAIAIADDSAIVWRNTTNDVGIGTISMSSTGASLFFTPTGQDFLMGVGSVAHLTIQSSGSLQALSLAGTGTRMVTADATGILSTATIPTGAAGANPTASITLAAQNGVATSFMRSDAAPALSQAIAPTWTATHIFSKVSTGPLPTVVVQSTDPQVDIWNTGAGAGQRRWNLTTSSIGGTFQIRALDDAGGTAGGGAGTAISIFRSGNSVVDVQMIQLTAAPRFKLTPTAATILGMNAVPVTQAASVTLTTAQSGAIFHNTGAAASITYTLPTAAVGLQYEFINVLTTAATDTIVVRAVGTDVIKNGTNVSPAAGQVTGDAENVNCRLVCLTAGVWTVFDDQGGVWAPGA